MWTLQACILHHVLLSDPMYRQRLTHHMLQIGIQTCWTQNKSVMSIVLLHPAWNVPLFSCAHLISSPQHILKKKKKIPVASYIARVYDPQKSIRVPFIKRDVNCPFIAMATQWRRGCQSNLAGLIIHTPCTPGMCTTLYAPAHTLLHL